MDLIVSVIDKVVHIIINVIIINSRKFSVCIERWRKEDKTTEKSKNNVRMSRRRLPGPLIAIQSRVVRNGNRIRRESPECLMLNIQFLI